MTSIGDVYEVKLKSYDADLKQMENVFFYRYNNLIGLGNPGVSETLANVFDLVVVAAQIPMTPPSIKYNMIQVRNLFDPADAFDKPINKAGTRPPGSGTSQLLPSHDAVKVMLNTDNGLVKKGRKMLAGLMENDQTNGLIDSIPYASWVLRIAVFTMDVVDSVIGGQKSFSPIVVKRVREGTPDNYTYRLPTTQWELVYGNIQSAIMSSIVTTQNSRKD